MQDKSLTHVNECIIIIFLDVIVVKVFFFTGFMFLFQHSFPLPEQSDSQHVFLVEISLVAVTASVEHLL